MARLFGTDGIRRLVGGELTAEMAFKLGLAGAKVLTKPGEKPGMVIGMDTRISSDMLAAALSAGICSVGGDVHNVGVVPTSAVAHLVRKYGLSAGIMVSASHNTFEDNGIKFYNGDGYKLTDETEDKIEELLPFLNEIPQAQGGNVGRIMTDTDGLGDYIEFLKSCINNISLKGTKIALDCANGAAYKAAPRVFSELGANISVIGDNPDGVNINANCGSTHIKTLVNHVKNGDYDLAFAFDGDADRCFAVDSNGFVLDGDMIMNVIAAYRKTKGLLAKDTVVATVMSNLGFLLAAEKCGIKTEQVQVGDRYVLGRMIEGGYNLGGEQSGHIICLDHHTTGDGILTALILSAIAAESGKKLNELNTMVALPQVLANAVVANSAKQAVLDDINIINEIKVLTKHFEGRGRVLIRPSGTEALVRVMIEGEDVEEITTHARKLADMMEETAKKIAV